MTLPKETIGTGASSRCACGEHLPLRVCSSGAGYYVGTWCVTCGPNSRESGYYKSYPEADAALRSGDYGRS